MSEPKGYIGLFNALGLPMDVDRYTAMQDRLNGPPRIAIIGMISRGKSTLVNQLIGVDLAPVKEIGETVADVSIMSGHPSFRRVTEDGTILHGTEPPDVARSLLLRSAEPPIAAAEYQWPLRLPGGVCIVDTPGVDDPRAGIDQAASLSDRWKRSGASGAILVVSAPPGLASSDQRILEAAEEFFGDSIVVCVKPTESTMSLEDLDEVTTNVKRHVRHLVVQLGHVSEVGRWGTGDLAPVENAINGLMAAAEARLADARDYVDDCARIALRRISTASLPDLPRLEAAATLRDLPDAVRTQLLSRITALQHERAEQQREERIRREARERDLLDRQAGDFINLIRRVQFTANPSGHALTTLRELSDLAIKGSPSAQAEILKWLRWLSPDARRHIGLDVKSILRANGGSVIAALELLASDLVQRPSAPSESGLSAASQATAPLIPRAASKKAFAMSDAKLLAHTEVEFKALGFCVSLTADEILALIQSPGSSATTGALRLVLAYSLATTPISGGTDKDSLIKILLARGGKVPELRSPLELGVVGALERWGLKQLQDLWNLPVVDAMSSLKTFDDRFQGEIGSLDQYLGQEARASLGHVLIQARQRVVDRARQLAAAERKSIIDSCNRPPENIPWTRVTNLLPALEWLYRIDCSHETYRLLMAFHPQGELHEFLRRVQAHLQQCVDRANSVRATASFFYVLSYVLWGISLLILLTAFNDDPDNAGIAFFLWILSMVVWAASRPIHRSGVTWTKYYVRTEVPRTGTDGCPV